MTGISNSIRAVTTKKKSPKLQVINVVGSAENLHLYGKIEITPQEAKFGVNKLVNIPWGFQKRILRVTVPMGITHGTVLRLIGMGKSIDRTEKGNLYLKVEIGS